MSIETLPYEEQQRVRWVLDWITRMANKYGGTVREGYGKTWDWGQALCRECYGPDWNKVISDQNITTPSWADIERAKKWEAGDIPDWVEKEMKNGSSKM